MATDGFEIITTEIKSTLDRGDQAFELLGRIRDLPPTFLDNGSPAAPTFARRYVLHARRYVLHARRWAEGDESLLAVAACGIPLTGGYARVWAPYIGVNAPDSISSKMFDAIARVLGNDSTPHALAIVDKNHTLAWNEFVEHGYVAMSEVQHLVCFLDAQNLTDSSARRASPASLRLTPVTDTPFDRFLGVLAATYENSADGPALAEQFSAAPYGLDEVKHRWWRTPPPERSVGWSLATIDGKSGPTAVGCLVLSLTAESKPAELVYMGLLPEYRGKGLGRELVLFAQRRMCRVGKETMTVSIDADNDKARRCYISRGFMLYGESAVLVKRLSG